MERLDCHVKEYAWGKAGDQSEVARLFAAGHPNFRIGSSTPYAELWMGTHPDGPARLRTGEHLSRVIAKGKQTGEREDIHLPFIMKIMAIRHTLSLQVHPTKEQAAILHSKDPINYPDAHHKPELAYALTRFELLCGFRPADEILRNMRAFPELRIVMGERNCAHFEQQAHAVLAANGHCGEDDQSELKRCLKACFAHMLELQVRDAPLVGAQLESLYRRLGERGAGLGCVGEDTLKVMWDTYQRFPGDVGCFAPLYLNHLILQPGECCYYAAEELHAYLSGECVECVGCSNNTIRAGLTPKYVDRENLVEVLNYRMTHPDFYMVPARPLLPAYPHVVEYAPDCKDFTLHQIDIPTPSAPKDTTAMATFNLPPLECGSIMIVVEGEAECIDLGAKDGVEGSVVVNRGDIFYIPPKHSLQLGRVSSHTPNGHRFLAYRTFSYEEGPDHSQRKTKLPAAALPIRTPQPNNQRKLLSASPIAAAADTTNESNNNSLILPLKVIQQATSAKKRRPFMGREIFDVESEMDGFI